MKTRNDIRLALLHATSELDDKRKKGWKWGEYMPELSGACGITDYVPDIATREGFTTALRRVIPEKEYKRLLVQQRIEALIDAIFAFHGLTPPPRAGFGAT